MRPNRLYRGGPAKTVAMACLLLSCLSAPLAFTPSAAGAEADAGWRAPVAVTRGIVEFWDVAMGTGGRAAAVWYSDRYLMAALRAPGVGWLPPRRLARGPDLRLFGAYLTVAMNARGGIVIVYQQRDRILAIRKPAGRAWQRPRLLLQRARSAGGLEVSLGRGGDATVIAAVHPDADHFKYRIVALRGGPGGNWQRPQRLGTGQGPRVVTGPRGRVTVAWWCDPGICTRTHGGHGDWSATHRVFRRSFVPGLSLAVDGIGTVYLTVDSSSTNRVALLSQRPGSRWRKQPVPHGDWWEEAQMAAAGRGWAAVMFEGPGRHRDSGALAIEVKRPHARWSRFHYVRAQQDAGIAISDKGHVHSSPTGFRRFGCVRVQAGRWLVRYEDPRPQRFGGEDRLRA